METCKDVYMVVNAIYSYEMTFFVSKDSCYVFL
jgi:hypothetical protein